LSKDVSPSNRDRFIELGIKIGALSKMRGMTQEQLADKVKMSRSHLSSIEAPNIVRPFSVEVLFNIADALEVDAGELLSATLPARKEK
jgi:transcriptional regulator with XRE-family HTH domain